MPQIAGILTQSQATEMNLAASFKQWIYQNVKLPYDTQAQNLGLSSGVQLQSDNTWKNVDQGLAIMNLGPTDDSLYLYVPVVGWLHDDKENSRDSEPTGCGDNAYWEYRTCGMVCLPGLVEDSSGKTMADRKSQMWLRTYMSNAFLRAKTIPIVDATQAPTNPLPQIGYMEVTKAYPQNMGKDLSSLLAAHRLRFDFYVEIRWAVQATN